MGDPVNSNFCGNLPLYIIFRGISMEIKSPILTPRLDAAASFVRKGSTVADVGTDHAYLPIVLALKDKIKGAIASDINEGPYLRALDNVKSHSLENKITVLHTPGLNGVEKYSPTDIVICGMGGELIASILSDAPWTKTPSVRLVLQPMTHSEILRKYLHENKFHIIDEKLAKEEKIYEIICAEYKGEQNADNYTSAELLLGKKNIERGDGLFLELLCHHLALLTKIATAKKAAGADASKEDSLISELEELKR